MKVSMLPVLCIVSLFFSMSTLNAQKYGHVNLGNLLTMLPEIETKSIELENYRNKLRDELQLRIDTWEKKVIAVQNKANDLPPKEMRLKEEELLKEQEILLKEEQMLSQQVLSKRNQIMGPIIEKTQNAIKEVSRGNGYTMVFDTSIPNITLFAKESDDLTKLVLSKLGVKPVEKKE